MHLRRLQINREKFPVTDRYPFNLKSLSSTGAIELSTPVTFFVGENGSGKSTLLEALARCCQIYIWGDSEKVQYVPNPYVERFHSVLDIAWQDSRVPGSFFGSQVFRNYTKLIETWACSDPGILDYYGGKSLLTQSHGQSIMSFFEACFKVKGLYLLDEPEAGLSPGSQMKLLELFKRYSADGTAQFIVATHSPVLMSLSGSNILSFDHAPVTEIDFKESQNYKMYRSIFTSDMERKL